MQYMQIKIVQLDLIPLHAYCVDSNRKLCDKAIILQSCLEYKFDICGCVDCSPYRYPACKRCLAVIHKHRYHHNENWNKHITFSFPMNNMLAYNLCEAYQKYQVTPNATIKHYNTKPIPQMVECDKCVTIYQNL